MSTGAGAGREGAESPGSRHLIAHSGHSDSPSTRAAQSPRRIMAGCVASQKILFVLAHQM
jgi:hypothetical protein